MSATLVPLIPKAPTVATTFLEVARSAEDVRAAIAATSTVAEAFALYEQLRALSHLMIEVTDDAAARCEELLNRM